MLSKKQGKNELTVVTLSLCGGGGLGRAGVHGRSQGQNLSLLPRVQGSGGRDLAGEVGGLCSCSGWVCSGGDGRPVVGTGKGWLRFPQAAEPSATHHFRGHLRKL